jgi:hypothetical protein
MLRYALYLVDELNTTVGSGEIMLTGKTEALRTRTCLITTVSTSNGLVWEGNDTQARARTRARTHAHTHTHTHTRGYGLSRRLERCVSGAEPYAKYLFSAGQERFLHWLRTRMFITIFTRVH